MAKEIEDCFGMPVPASILSVEEHPLSDFEAHRGPFDFIYSLEILNRLTSSCAKELVADLMARLKPGGRLLLADRAMNRTEEELAELTAGIPEDLTMGHVVFRDADAAIAFLDIYR